MDGLGGFRGVGLMVKYSPNAQGVLGLPGGSSYRPLQGIQWPQKNIMMTWGQEVSSIYR